MASYESFTSVIEAAAGIVPSPDTTYPVMDVKEGIEVWNPVHEPDRQHRWAVFHFPKKKLYKGDPNTEYKMLVYKKSNDSEFYFFSNDVAWCLGYEDILPHEAVERYVPKKNQMKIDFGSGIFLTRQGVRDFIAVTPDGEDKDLFVDWFEKYLKFCENNRKIDVYNDCPA